MKWIPRGKLRSNFLDCFLIISFVCDRALQERWKPVTRREPSERFRISYEREYHVLRNNPPHDFELCLVMG